jgi:hypothetical protein
MKTSDKSVDFVARDTGNIESFHHPSKSTIHQEQAAINLRQISSQPNIQRLTFNAGAAFHRHSD